MIGALLYVWGIVGGETFGYDSFFFTSVCVLLPVLITGGIHLDGLLDTSDALSSYKPTEEKLQILKDSHAGAFAIIIGICYFIADIGVYSELTRRALPVLACTFAMSRSFSGLSVVSFKMAKNTGLAATFSDMAVKGRVKNHHAGVSGIDWWSHDLSGCASWNTCNFSGYDRFFCI